MQGNNVGCNVFMFFEMQQTLSVYAYRISAVLKFVSVSELTCLYNGYINKHIHQVTV